MTEDQQKDLNELMQYAQVAAPPTPASGWGTFPIPQSTQPQSASSLPINPVPGT
jgi:hypothetical protein